jgi:hypothetical protein
MFRRSDNTTFTVALANCNGSNAAVVSARNCTIPSSVFNANPFSLTWGSSIFARVIAINIKGNSVTSDAGNGAVILT